MPLSTYRTLRDQEAEFNRLEQENFNYKMRIHFLEEQLIRLNNGDTIFGSKELEAEVARLHIALEERDQQLAEQDASMIRATHAIDTLKRQLRDAQTATTRAEEREFRPAVEDDEDLCADMQSSRQVRELQLKLRSAKEAVKMLSEKVEYARENYMRDMDIAAKAKTRDLEILQYQKRENDKLRVKVMHVRRMIRDKDELVKTLRAKVESIWQRKEQEAKEHTVTLTRMSNEAEEARLKEEQCHAYWHITCVNLEEDWLAQYSKVMEEVRKLKSELSRETLQLNAGILAIFLDVRETHDQEEEFAFKNLESWRAKILPQRPSVQ